MSSAASSSQPAPLAPVVELMSTYPGRWLICGGWAVDAWLGRVTRSHGDIDVMVFEDEQRIAFDQFAAWDMVAHDAIDPTATTEPWTGRRLELPAHVHARPKDAESPANLLRWVTPPYEQLRDDRNIEIILNRQEAGRWRLHEAAGVSRPWPDCFATTPWGFPAAVPEVLLFYKATAHREERNGKPRPHDQQDFDALFPLLSPPAVAWLREAIAAVVPAHPWLNVKNMVPRA